MVCTRAGTFGAPLNFWSSSSGRLSIFGVPPPLNFHPEESNVRQERQKLNSSGWKMRINRKEGGKEGGEEGFRLSTAQRLLAVHFHPCMQFIVLNYSLCSGDPAFFVAAPVPPRSSARHSESQVFGPQRGPASLHTRRPSPCRRIPKTLAPTPNHRGWAQHGLSVPRQLTADMQLHCGDRLASP